MANKKINNMDELKQELLNEIDNRFKIILNEFNSLYNELLNKANTQTLEVVKASKENMNTALLEVNNIKSDVEKRFNKATKQFEKATQVLDLGNNEINADSIKDLFRVTHKNDVWIEENSKNLDKISKEFETAENSLSDIEKEEGILLNIKNKVDKVRTEIENTEKALQLAAFYPKKDTNLSSAKFDIIVNDNNINISNKHEDKIIIHENGIEIWGNVIINGQEF